jgi:adenylate cyclase
MNRLPTNCQWRSPISGAQEVKNIPTPVHALLVAMRREEGRYAMPRINKQGVKARTAVPAWMWPLAATVVCVVAIGVGGFLYRTKLELANSPKEALPAGNVAAAGPAPAVSAPLPSVPVATATASSVTPSRPPNPSGEKLVANAVSFVSDRTRRNLASDYVPASDHKAFALNINGVNGSAVGRPNEEAAKTAALDQCAKRADAIQSPRKCELYAVGNAVVYRHGLPPMPPPPWVKHDASTERPFAATDMPLIRDAGRERLDKNYPSAKKSKSIALGPGGQFIYLLAIESREESNRRSLESCGALAGVACTIVAAEDVFVLPVPASMKAIGFFQAASNASIAANARDDVVRKLADARSGWNAVAVGAAGRPGLGLKSASEQHAISDALGDCAKRDSDCRVIAIGPFAVGPN